MQIEQAVDDEAELFLDQGPMGGYITNCLGMPGLIGGKRSGSRMATSKKSTSEIELHPDAWARFERAADVVAKSPPQHRAAAKPKGRKPKAKGGRKGKTDAS